MDTSCVLTCPKSYNLNVLTNSCEAGTVTLVSFSFLFLFSIIFLALTTILISMIASKCKNKTMDVVYAIVGMAECANRLCILGELFAKNRPIGVFPLAGCFMNIVATSSLGLFFNLLFMTPIYAHSPKFRNLWKTQYPNSYSTVEWLTYIAGVNCMRLLSSSFMGMKAFSSDINDYKFFLVPLNLVSNYTLLFSCLQLILDIFMILYLPPNDDIFTLAALGLGLNAILATLQLFKHLTTTRTFPDSETSSSSSL